MGKIGTLRRKADRLMQQRPKPPCENCGKPGTVFHHFFPKSVSANLRYNDSNLICLCQGCHLRHHCGDPTIHATILRKRGQKWYDELMKEKVKIIKVNKEYYKKIIEEYERL